MKFYTVIFIDFQKEGLVKFIGEYESPLDAERRLMTHALNMVRENNGERHIDSAVQNEKTQNEIVHDVTLNSNALYLQENKNENLIHVYEKSVKDVGVFMSNMKHFITKIGVFSIMETEHETPIRYSCECSLKMTNFELEKNNNKNNNNNKNSSNAAFDSVPIHNVINELKLLLNGGGDFGLKKSVKFADGDIDSDSDNASNSDNGEVLINQFVSNIINT
jgi:hypothetical protein